MDSRTTSIRDFVQHLLQLKGDYQQFTSSDSLVISGRLDSLSIVELVVFLEEQFGLDLSDRPFDQNDFDSLESIATLLAEELD